MNSRQHLNFKITCVLFAENNFVFQSKMYLVLIECHLQNVVSFTCRSACMIQMTTDGYLTR